jgi:cytochrome c oxidase subunit 3
MDTAGATAGHAEEGGDEAHEHSSRWPLVAAVGAGGLYVGAGLWLIGGGLVPTVLPVALLVAGVGGLLTGLAGWTYEAFLTDYLAGADRDRLYRGGMVLFIVSDVATFSAGFVYYGFVRVGPWPPGELPSLLSSLVVVNTLLLLASSVTLHYAHGSLESGDQRRFKLLLGATLALGVVFLAGQAYEYYEFAVVEGFTLSDGVFASAFYGLTGLHGLHVSLGAVMIGLVTARAFRGDYAPDRDTSVSTVSLYWHFVDGVWVFLVAVLYVGAALG